MTEYNIDDACEGYVSKMSGWEVNQSVSSRDSFIYEKKKNNNVSSGNLHLPASGTWSAQHGGRQANTWPTKV